MLSQEEICTSPTWRTVSPCHCPTLRRSGHESKISELWRLFKAYDPPRILIPANVLAPVTTRGEPQSASVAPMLSPSHDPDPEETRSSNDVPPASTTMQAPKAAQPQQAANPGPDFGNQGLNKKPSSSTGIIVTIGKM